MGFFSWITQDTDRSIPNIHSQRETFPVTMTDNKGNRYHEKEYDGYGVFGGKDYYDLLAEMNGYKREDCDNEQQFRLVGIQLEFGVHFIENKELGLKFKAQGHDFFNWSEDIVYDGKSANELLKLDGWKSGNDIPEGTIFPNLTEDPNWEWKNAKPENCGEQGFFYPEEMDDLYNAI